MLKQKRRSQGITLIEILIALAIIGVIAAIGYPSYISYYAQSYRADVLREIARAVNRQESFYADQLTYTADMKELGYDTDPYTSESGNYTIDVVTDSSTDLEQEFLIRATAKTAQAENDPSCVTMSMNHLGEKFSEDKDKNDTSQTCWY